MVSRVIAEPKPQGWSFGFDAPAPRTLIPAGESLELRGWIIDRNKSVTDIRVVRERDGRDLGQLEVGQAREGVAAVDPKLRHAGNGGFGGVLSLNEAGRYRVEVWVAGGARVPIFSFVLRDPAAQPTKLLFMHIAKTAGTSVNRFLSESVGAARCAFHLEVDPRWRTQGGRAELAKSSVISGHITYPVLSSRLDCDDYLKVTLLRNPLDHVLSHLAFIRHLAEPSQRSRLAGHSPAIRAFAAKLAATDFADRKAVKALVAGLGAEEIVLVDNVQVRYLSSVASAERVRQSHLQSARQSLIHFDHVGLTEQMEPFLAGIASRMNWPLPRYVPQENRNPERYGIDADNPELRAALKPLVIYDQLLYRYARKVFIDGNDGPAQRLRKKAQAAKSTAAASAPQAKPVVRTA
ncbi:hypothetical protein [Hydrocarboniphaga sp.]|uniref:hypothetical protein n=1 Tax=Hydrocarboniphaga sp. TaxID=2033016 RepID=UPI00261F3C78|nr:hypothetical protein [Hydrocarboniphaga sp.]